MEASLPVEPISSEVVLEVVDDPLSSAESSDGRDDEAAEEATSSPPGEGELLSMGTDPGAGVPATILEPRLIFWPVPQYPEKVEKIDGVDELRILVGEDGSVKAAEIVSGTSIEAYNEAAFQAVLRSRWEPGLVEGRPMEMWTTFTFRFSAR